MAMEQTRDRASGSRQVVVFGLGEERYATDVTRVQEIIRWTEPRSVSSSLPAVRGVINLRGKIIPVCDLDACLGAVSSAPDEDSKIVVVETSAGVCGLIVDEVHEVRTPRRGGARRGPRRMRPTRASWTASRRPAIS